MQISIRPNASSNPTDTIVTGSPETPRSAKSPSSNCIKRASLLNVRAQTGSSSARIPNLSIAQSIQIAQALEASP
jgi:hypothetical protein